MNCKSDVLKEYNKEYRQKAKFNKKTWYTKTYGRMKRDSKHKFKNELDFSKEEFIIWVEKQGDKFSVLFQEYVNSGFDKYKNPSVDRIDDYCSYTFDNMQLMSWKDNDIKGRNGLKNKKQCSNMAKKYWSKKVYVYNSNIELIFEFDSTRDAARYFGYSDNSGIARACRKKLKYKGYIWRYELYE